MRWTHLKADTVNPARESTPNRWSNEKNPEKCHSIFPRRSEKKSFRWRSTENTPKTQNQTKITKSCFHSNWSQIVDCKIYNAEIVCAIKSDEECFNSWRRSYHVKSVSLSHWQPDKNRRPKARNRNPCATFREMLKIDPVSTLPTCRKSSFFPDGWLTSRVEILSICSTWSHDPDLKWLAD